MTQQEQPVTAEDYRTLFEHSNLGQRILDDLYRRFSQPPVTDGGIDAVLKTYTRAGERNVVEFIIKRINRANQVPESGTNDTDAGE